MDFVGFVRDIGVSRKHSKQNDDLFVDRLNYKYTVTILVLFAILITGTHYVGTPINCWVPGHFTGNYERYAERICWVSSTYNIPILEDIPHEEPDRKDKMLKYYQWTAFILLFQALLFYIPRMIWRSMNDKSGLDIQSLVDVVHSYQKDKSDFVEKDKVLNYLTTAFDRYVSATKMSKKIETDDNASEAILTRSPTLLKRSPHVNDPSLKYADDGMSDDEDYGDHRLNNGKGTGRVMGVLKKSRHAFNIFCITMGKRYGNYLLVLFIFVKILYVINSISQLFILNQFLGNDYLLLGMEVMHKVWNGDDWSQMKRFPRVTLCDFRVREVGVVHRYTVQCVLQINLFNEKIFIFLWYWLCLVSLFNVIDLISWSYSLIINSRERYLYVKRRMYFMDKQPQLLHNENLAGRLRHTTNKFDKKIFQKFVNNYLREDGVLALRLLSKNAHDLIVSEVITKLYDVYLNRYEEEQELRVKQQQRRANLNDHTVEIIENDLKANEANVKMA